MKKFAIMLLLSACANLDRPSVDQNDPTPDGGGPVDNLPGLLDGGLAGLPDANQPPPPSAPECLIDLDCQEGYVCVDGSCHQTCDCDFDCGNHYECHSHVCYNPHGDSPGGN